MRLRRSLQRVAILAVYTLAAGCHFLPESCFDLSPESRIPDWFSVPPAMAREDVTVHMCYYISGDGRTATFEMRRVGKEMKQIAEASGKQRGLYPLYPPNSAAAATHGYPSYEVVTVGDVAEVIEHRRAEPIFYIVDDPSIRHVFGVTPANRDAGKNLQRLPPESAGPSQFRPPTTHEVRSASLTTGTR